MPPILVRCLVPDLLFLRPGTIPSHSERRRFTQPSIGAARTRTPAAEPVPSANRQPTSRLTSASARRSRADRSSRSPAGPTCPAREQCTYC